MNNLNSLYVDSQSIIKSVQTRTPLWDRNHISHKDPDVLESLWNEVSTEVNLPKELLKAKWKGLRDTFRKEFKKSQSSRWIHYKSLVFLEDNMVTDKTVTVDPNSDNQNSNGSTCEKPSDEKNVNDSLSVKEESMNLDDNLNYDDEETRSFTATDILETEIDHLESENADAPNIKFTGISSECTDSVGAEFNPNLGKTFPNLTNFVCNNENIAQGIDDDFHFFMSLIPHIKPLPLEKKLELRMKMQQIIYNEMTSPN